MNGIIEKIAEYAELLPPCLSLSENPMVSSSPRILLDMEFGNRQLPFRPKSQNDTEKDMVFREWQKNDRRSLQPEIIALPDADSR